MVDMRIYPVSPRRRYLRESNTIRTSTLDRTNAQIHICYYVIHTYIHPCTHIYIYIYTYICIHTHTFLARASRTEGDSGPKGTANCTIDL